MKVVPQIITFLVLVALGWLAYDSHEAFRKLVDDIVDISGVTHEYAPVSQPTAPTVQQADASLAARPPAGNGGNVVPDTPVAEATETPEQSVEIVTDVTQDKTPESSASIVSADTGMPEQSVMSEPQDQKAQPAIISESEQKVEEDQTVEASSVVEPELSEPAAMVDESTARSNDDPEVEADTTVDAPVVREPAPAGEQATRQQSAPPRDQEAAKPDEQAIAKHMQTRKENALTGLAAAREAWHLGNHDKAISLYIGLMREYRNHPDFPGELGNIYFARGQMDFAVKAYSEAFHRLVGNNDLERAQKVLRIVYNLDEEQAYVLKDYLMR